MPSMDGTSGNILAQKFPGKEEGELEAWEALIKKYQDQSKDVVADSVKEGHRGVGDGVPRRLVPGGSRELLAVCRSS